MFNNQRIIKLAEKGLLKENKHNISSYILISDKEIQTQKYKFTMTLWSNGDITFYDNFYTRELQGEYINNKITGKSTIKYRKDIKEAINMFNKKYRDIIRYNHINI